MKAYQRALTGAAALLFAVAGATFAIAAPAAANPCQTNAHVYLIRNGYFIKYQSDPIDGAFFDIAVPYNTTVSFDLGGNGLKDDEDPFWDVYNGSGGYLRTQMGNRAQGNCVSNQRTIYTSGSQGAVEVYRATYQPGNTGGVIGNQAHFRLLFILDPPPPVDPPDPPDPPCGGQRICEL